MLTTVSCKRPVLVIGNGVHLAHAEDDCRKLVNYLGIPVVSSWTAADIVPTDHPAYIGRFGIFGDRASNFTVQNADYLLVIGSRLSIPQTGYRTEFFARAAHIVMVDVDIAEMNKPSLRIAQRILSNAGEFIRWALENMKPPECADWLARCQDWKRRYPMSFEDRSDEGLNSYHFIETLSKALPDDAIVVTDMGTAFTCTFQAARMKLGQRWLTASGHAPMGYGLPGAVGAHYATGKPVVCIVGDGAMMFNLGTLQTIAHHNLPITIFALNNGGYLTMKHTFANHFGRQVGTDAKSGVSFPDFGELAGTFGIPYQCDGMRLSTAGPYLVEIRMPHHQPLTPRSTSMKLPDGSITSRPIEDLFPFLSREQLVKEMIVPIVEVFQ